ncbi:aldo/keto reductase [Streptomyces neyagawaensis]|uniref:aldo/keto reductase n=1 Tax=Streptomyces neyagawaensis TaxID=42238 RepID=UPI0006E303D1|nr:aldo/keto reductase [Streptomyces neyagawaensis]
MRTRTLGRTDVEVTELSYGAAGIGNLYRPVTDKEAAATVDAAWDAGIRTFDTAPHYGLGLSERRLGAALRDRPRESYTVSTKVGRLLVPADGDGDGHGAGDGDDLANGFAVPATLRRVWDFSADGVRRSLEASLHRLGLDRVDIVLLHDPDDHAEQALDEAYPALERLRGEGVVGAIGVGMNQSALPTRFLRETDIDVVLLAGRYTLLEQEGLTELLPEAAARGRSVLAGGVLNSGLLAEPAPGATYDYAPAPEPVLDRARRLKAVTERHGVPLRAAALHFPLGHPAVASVLTGARSTDEVRDTVEQLRAPVPAALWDELRAEGLLAPDVPVPTPRTTPLDTPHAPLDTPLEGSPSPTERS